MSGDTVTLNGAEPPPTVAIGAEPGTVLLVFDRIVDHVGLDPESAISVAQQLCAQAKAAGLQGSAFVMRGNGSNFAAQLADVPPAPTFAEVANAGKPPPDFRAVEGTRFKDEDLDNLWIGRRKIHGGQLMPQLRDFARAVEMLVRVQCEDDSAKAIQVGRSFADALRNIPPGPVVELDLGQDARDAQRWRTWCAHAVASTNENASDEQRVALEREYNANVDRLIDGGPPA